MPPVQPWPMKAISWEIEDSDSDYIMNQARL